MTDNKKIPFVGLHAHSVASVFDGLGYPQDHMDFAYENGSNALALTDHGNMNGLSYQVLHAKKMHAEGKEFKPIYGCEIYYIPSVDDWREQYELARQNKKAVNALKAGLATNATVIEDENRSGGSKEILKYRAHMVLLVQNQEGLNNLFKLISESYTTEYFYRFPRIDHKLLKKYSAGLIASSACLGGVYAQDMWHNRDDKEAAKRAMMDTTDRMVDIFGDKWYGELQWNDIPEQHDLNEMIIDVCQKKGVKLISTADSHYPRPELWKDRELYKKLGWLSKGGLDGEIPETVEELSYELYPKNGNQMWDSYLKYSKNNDRTYDDKLVYNSLVETANIAHKRIESFYPDTTVRLPSFVVSKGKTASIDLAEKCKKGLIDKSLHKDPVYLKRLIHELKVIDDRGFSKYFLTMKAIADKATEIQITGPGRGSAAGSLVAYVLDITQVDPIKYNLLFSRFLRSDATDYPDIDYDTSEPMELKEKLIKEWGHTTVVPISNWNTLQLKSLIKDISKLYGIPFKEVNEVTGKMMSEATPAAKAENGITSGIYSPTFDETMRHSSTLRVFLDKYPNVKTHVETLYGQIRSASRHAGGCLVGENLDFHMPLINSGGVRQTPWSEGQNVRHLEPMGFIKFDILGLSTLRMIESCIDNILRGHHGYKDVGFDDIVKYYREKLHPDVIDLNDQNVYRNVFQKGKWAGIFQFTEQGAQGFCKQAKPSSIIDIAAITSIFRPGPLAAKVDKMYIAAKADPDDISYIHPLVKEITKETYGFLIFQEQIAIIANKLGKDLSMDEANLLRKVLTKRGTGKEVEVKRKLYKKFIDGCLEKEIPQSTADDLWEKFEYFSGYGFNKSHAVSYSLLSYQCAWLFNYYPAEWLAAFLDKEPESRKEKSINIVKTMGFKIKPLDINQSTEKWTVTDDKKHLIQPFSSIKGLGAAAIDQIVRNRPFNTIDELLFKKEIVHSKLNKKSLDVLLRSGAVDCLMDERFNGPKHMWASIVSERPKSAKKFAKNIAEYSEQSDFTIEERIQNSADVTGVFPVSLVVNEDVLDKADSLGALPLGRYPTSPEEADEFEEAGLPTNWWFIPREVVEKTTAKGKLYYVLKVIDSTNQLNTIRIWGAAGKRFDHATKKHIEYKKEVYINKVYCSPVKYDVTWGFSIHGAMSKMKLMDA